MVGGWLPWTVALALSSPAAAAPAEGAARAEFSWDAPAGCPAEPEVRRLVEDQLGASLDSARGRVSVIVRVRQEQDGYSMRLWAVTVAGTHERELWHARCDVLAHATSVVVAIAVDPAMRESVEVQRPARMALGDDLSLGPVRACTPGQERCRCGSLGACDGGLICLSRMCVRPPASPPPPVIEPAGSNVADHDRALLEDRRRNDRLIVAGYVSWISGLAVLTLVGGAGLGAYLDDRSNGAARRALIVGATAGGLGIISGVTVMLVGYKRRSLVMPHEDVTISALRPRSRAHRRPRTSTRSRPTSSDVIPPM